MNTLEFTRFPALDYACTEAVNTLCTNLSFVGSDVKKIVVTSCKASEGKSFLCMNAMRTLSGLGKRVALVDADLRRSMIDAKFGIRTEEKDAYGMTHYLAGMCGIEDVVYSTNIVRSYMVPVGRAVSNSLSLLSTPKLKQLLDKLAEMFDLVLVDAPPVGVIIDAAEIARCCDGALFVTNYNQVSRRELQDAQQQIAQTGCKILGAVLNNVEFDSYTSRKYYNKYYYTHYESKEYQPRKAGSRRSSASSTKRK